MKKLKKTKAFTLIELLVVVAIIENGESGSAVAAPLVRRAINLYSNNEK